MDASTFYWEVYNLVNGDTDRPIYTLCRTGSRSIDAANILADPANTANDPRRVGKEVYDAPAFKNVRNIWEGFVGRELYAFVDGNPDPNIKLDLNNDGFINSDKADVYAHTTDEIRTRMDGVTFSSYRGKHIFVYHVLTSKTYNSTNAGRPTKVANNAVPVW
jgi:hypothetical protein